jgi:hypothetical protein
MHDVDPLGQALLAVAYARVVRITPPVGERCGLRDMVGSTAWRF